MQPLSLIKVTVPPGSTASDRASTTLLYGCPI